MWCSGSIPDFCSGSSGSIPGMGPAISAGGWHSEWVWNVSSRRIAIEKTQLCRKKSKLKTYWYYLLRKLNAIYFHSCVVSTPATNTKTPTKGWCRYRCQSNHGRKARLQWGLSLKWPKLGLTFLSRGSDPRVCWLKKPTFLWGRENARAAFSDEGGADGHSAHHRRCAHPIRRTTVTKNKAKKTETTTTFENNLSSPWIMIWWYCWLV